MNPAQPQYTPGHLRVVTIPRKHRHPSMCYYLTVDARYIANMRDKITEEVKYGKTWMLFEMNDPDIYEQLREYFVKAGFTVMRKGNSEIIIRWINTDNPFSKTAPAL